VNWPRSALIVAAAAVVLSGCTSRTNGEANVAAAHSSGLASPPTSAEAAAADEPELSPRGAIPKQIGEAAGLCNDEKCTAFAVTFTVDKIEVDVQCTEPYAEPPANGHYIALTMTIKTTDLFGPDLVPLFNISPFSWEIIGADGITEASDPGAGAYSCLPTSDLPPAGLSPSSQYVTTMVLDSRNASGILLLRMPNLVDGGWEWTF
jgi:hypothetical protein